MDLSQIALRPWEYLVELSAQDIDTTSQEERYKYKAATLLYNARTTAISIDGLYETDERTKNEQVYFVLRLVGAELFQSIFIDDAEDMFKFDSLNIARDDIDPNKCGFYVAVNAPIFARSTSEAYGPVGKWKAFHSIVAILPFVASKSEPNTESTFLFDNFDLINKTYEDRLIKLPKSIIVDVANDAAKTFNIKFENTFLRLSDKIGTVESRALGRFQDSPNVVQEFVTRCLKYVPFSERIGSERNPAFTAPALYNLDENTVLLCYVPFLNLQDAASLVPDEEALRLYGIGCYPGVFAASLNTDDNGADNSKVKYYFDWQLASNGNNRIRAADEESKIAPPLRMVPDKVSWFHTALCYTNEDYVSGNIIEELSSLGVFLAEKRDADNPFADLLYSPSKTGQINLQETFDSVSCQNLLKSLFGFENKEQFAAAVSTVLMEPSGQSVATSQNKAKMQRTENEEQNQAAQTQDSRPAGAFSSSSSSSSSQASSTNVADSDDAENSNDDVLHSSFEEESNDDSDSGQLRKKENIGKSNEALRVANNVATILNNRMLKDENTTLNNAEDFIQEKVFEKIDEILQQANDILPTEKYIKGMDGSVLSYYVTADTRSSFKDEYLETQLFAFDIPQQNTPDCVIGENYFALREKPTAGNPNKSWIVFFKDVSMTKKRKDNSIAAPVFSRENLDAWRIFWAVKLSETTNNGNFEFEFIPCLVVMHIVPQVLKVGPKVGPREFKKWWNDDLAYLFAYEDKQPAGMEKRTHAFKIRRIGKMLTGSQSKRLQATTPRPKNDTSDSVKSHDLYVAKKKDDGSLEYIRGINLTSSSNLTYVFGATSAPLNRFIAFTATDKQNTTATDEQIPTAIYSYTIKITRLADYPTRKNEKIKQGAPTKYDLVMQITAEKLTSYGSFNSKQLKILGDVLVFGFVIPLFEKNYATLDTDSEEKSRSPVEIATELTADIPSADSTATEKRIEADKAISTDKVIDFEQDEIVQILNDLNANDQQTKAQFQTALKRLKRKGDKDKEPRQKRELQTKANLPNATATFAKRKERVDAIRASKQARRAPPTDQSPVSAAPKKGPSPPPPDQAAVPPAAQPQQQPQVPVTQLQPPRQPQAPVPQSQTPLPQPASATSTDAVSVAETQAESERRLERVVNLINGQQKNNLTPEQIGSARQRLNALMTSANDGPAASSTPVGGSQQQDLGSPTLAPFNNASLTGSPISALSSARKLIGKFDDVALQPSNTSSNQSSPAPVTDAAQSSTANTVAALRNPAQQPTVSSGSQQQEEPGTGVNLVTQQEREQRARQQAQQGSQPLATTAAQPKEKGKEKEPNEQSIEAPNEGSLQQQQRLVGTDAQYADIFGDLILQSGRKRNDLTKAIRDDGTLDPSVPEQRIPWSLTIELYNYQMVAENEDILDERSLFFATTLTFNRPVCFNSDINRNAFEQLVVNSAAPNATMPNAQTLYVGNLFRVAEFVPTATEESLLLSRAISDDAEVVDNNMANYQTFGIKDNDDTLIVARLRDNVSKSERIVILEYSAAPTNNRIIFARAIIASTNSSLDIQLEFAPNELAEVEGNYLPISVAIVSRILPPPPKTPVTPGQPQQSVESASDSTNAAILAVVPDKISKQVYDERSDLLSSRDEAKQGSNELYVTNRRFYQYEPSKMLEKTLRLETPEERQTRYENMRRVIASIVEKDRQARKQQEQKEQKRREEKQRQQPNKPNEPFDVLVKIALQGQPGVGKASMVRAFVDDSSLLLLDGVNFVRTILMNPRNLQLSSHICYLLIV